MDILVTLLIAAFCFLSGLIFKAYIDVYKIDNAKIVTTFQGVMYLTAGWIVPIVGIVIFCLSVPLNKFFVILICIGFLIISGSNLLYLFRAQSKVNQNISKLFRMVEDDNATLSKNTSKSLYNSDKIILEYQLKICELLNQYSQLKKSNSELEINKIELGALQESIRNDIKAIDKEH